METSRKKSAESAGASREATRKLHVGHQVWLALGLHGELLVASGMVDLPSRFARNRTFGETEEQFFQDPPNVRFHVYWWEGTFPRLHFKYRVYPVLPVPLL